MTTGDGVQRKHLIFALVLAGVTGLGLVALGWWFMGWQHQTGWSRLSDGGWWTGTAVHWFGFLAFSKVGFKAAIGVVLIGVASLAWLRGRGKAPVGDPIAADANAEANGQVDVSETSR